MDNAILEEQYDWEILEEGDVIKLEDNEPVEVIYKNSDQIKSCRARDVDWSSVQKWRLVCL
ncbi:hypothetical protein O3W44_01365 [Pantoea sp. LMR881]|uniref:hypothetical protein n=1 Tax=Pantoea sp. LMR881 TaxID=3014336 RepID=UPI0022B04D23|nr:hypothetical protein [Pantoea sp. LMR881]MCZ4058019.1 hypothetical protein [Pantoea sp. LMR881]